MAFTRSFYDKEHVRSRLNDDYNNINYIVNVPGNGKTPYYIDDPQIRMQKFGANLSYNLVDINSSLIGLNQVLSRDQSEGNNGRNGNSTPFNDNFSKISFPSFKKAVTDQPRMMMPAWTLRDQEQNEWEYLHYNPQIKSEIHFENNISSRILEKDNYNSNKSIIVNE